MVERTGLVAGAAVEAHDFHNRNVVLLKELSGGLSDRAGAGFAGQHRLDAFEAEYLSVRAPRLENAVGVEGDFVVLAQQLSSVVRRMMARALIA